MGVDPNPHCALNDHDHDDDHHHAVDHHGWPVSCTLIPAAEPRC